MKRGREEGINWTSYPEVISDVKEILQEAYQQQGLPMNEMFGKRTLEGLPYDSAWLTG